MIKGKSKWNGRRKWKEIMDFLHSFYLSNSLFFLFFSSQKKKIPHEKKESYSVRRYYSSTFYFFNAFHNPSLFFLLGILSPTCLKKIRKKRDKIGSDDFLFWFNDASTEKKTNFVFFSFPFLFFLGSFTCFQVCNFQFFFFLEIQEKSFILGKV